MKRNWALITVFFTIFLDFFNLGLIYPLFTSLIFEGNGGLIAADASVFYKNTLFGFLIAAFPLGQFVGAPFIGYLSDQQGRRKLLLLSLIGTATTLFTCGVGVFLGSLLLLFLGRLAGGLMAGNLTIAYASLADFSAEEEKVRNFALIPLAMGVGFSFGPYLAGILANPETHALAGPTLPFLVATFFAFVNLALAYWLFPETFIAIKTEATRPFSNSLIKLCEAFKQPTLRPYLWILFLMISANMVYVQFVGPFAIERFDFDVTQVGYIYANVGVTIALGHLFLTRRLAGRFVPERALKGSLLLLGLLIALSLFSFSPWILHGLTTLILLACAVAYTNAMALVSNRAEKDQQGEIMGVAVAIQSCAEFLPAALLGLIAFISEMVPLAVAALFALWGYWLLVSLKKKVISIHEGVRDLF